MTIAAEWIPLSRPDVTEAEIDAVVSVLRTDRLSLGPHLAMFEAAVARRAGRKYGIGVNSGTSGLHLCVRGLGITEGDEVITTPFSFVATTTCFLFERARPVFVDIDIDSYNMDPAGVEEAITSRTRAIIPVEVFGNTSHFEAYERIARGNGLAMIEDSCEALGAVSNGRPAGNFGDAAVFGFYPNKQITVGEGGVIVTDDEQLRNACMAMRNQGRQDTSSPHECLGYNYRLSELSATMGEVQMQRLDDILAGRRQVARTYHQMLDGIDELHLPPCNEPHSASWFVYVIRLADRFCGTDRDELIQRLRKAGIGCERYFQPIHLQPFIAERFGYRPGSMPVTERVGERTVALPFFTQMKPEQIGRVAQEVRQALVGLGGARVAVPAMPEAPPEPAKDKVPFFRVLCDGNEMRYVREVLQSGWLTTASKALALEQAFAERVGAKYAVAVNSCTAALHLALEAMGVQHGDQVFVPTMTFTASAEVVRYLGAEPLLLDVEYGSCLLTPEILEEGIRRHPRAKAVVVVHFGGQPAPMYRDGGEGIVEVCRRHGVRIVEDAAHAFPARVAGRMVGALGDATCFSFYANKTITTGEGGMLTTDDEQIARRAMTMRLHGIDRDVWGRFTSATAKWEYDVVAPGYKYNMPDINAAVGLAQLERADDLWRGRYDAAVRYYERLAPLPCVDLPLCHVPMEDHAWHLLPIIIAPTARLTRNELIETLALRGISTSVHYKPLHRMSYYRQRYDLQPEQFPQAERVWQGCLSLPLFPSITMQDVDQVCDTLWELLG